MAKEEVKREQHAIEVLSGEILTSTPYFVQEVELEAVGATFIAHAFLVPLDSITNPVAGQPDSPRIRVILAQGGPAFSGMTLSVLNYLNLQGRSIVVKDLGTFENRLHHYFISKITTLRGKAFEAGLRFQYPKGRNSNR